MTSISPATKKMLALSMLQGVGPATLRKVAAQGLVSASVEVLSQSISAIARALAVLDAWEVAQELAEKQCAAAEKAEAYVVSALDEGYPILLSATKDDPFLLYVKGQLSKTPEKSVAIIGTREPTKHGEMIARRITEFFSGQHWSVVSGLALGCDALAHRAAIESGGHTVAVLAHGLQTIAPSQHRKLAQQILDSGGALVSEYRFGQGALPTQFVKRDRTQAGLAQGVVMIQSDLKGGSLHASRAALDYERWLAVPYPTDVDRASNEPKIQANLLIADASADTERATLLKCHPSRLSKVIVLRAKEDYPKMVSATFGDLDVQGSHAGIFDEMVHANHTSGHDQIGALPLIDSEQVIAEPSKLEAELAPKDASGPSTNDLVSRTATQEIQTDQIDSGLQTSTEKIKVTTPEHASHTPKAPKAKRGVKDKSTSKAELTVQQKLL
jgi:DNA processing protein